MTKVKKYLGAICNNQSVYLNGLIGVIIYISLGYIAYININAAILNQNISDVIINSSAQDGINLAINFAQLYSAYTVMQLKKLKDTKIGFIAFGLILISQALFTNIITFVIMLFYVKHFVGFKKIKTLYLNAQNKRDIKITISSVMVFFVAIITFMLKIKLGILV